MATFRQLFYNLAATLRKLPFHFETQFNSYYSTAILQSGGYSTNTAIPISKPNSIATVRQLFYNLAATLRKLPLLLRYRVFPPSTTHSISLFKRFTLSFLRVTLMGENRSIGAGAQRSETGTLLWGSVVLDAHSSWDSVEVLTGV
ncbi:hypothetical protein E4U30_005231 [Claviceps sp. LM220 group G6]|nr:hypothetical protein E4U30_005231 [Claviceps sp. LM220 group G6]